MPAFSGLTADFSVDDFCLAYVMRWIVVSQKPGNKQLSCEIKRSADLGARFFAAITFLPE
ncbi:MAG: hypothetical protein WBI69_01865 [Limnochordia bacterium]|jgi:hypothetical protein